MPIGMSLESRFGAGCACTENQPLHGAGRLDEFERLDEHVGAGADLIAPGRGIDADPEGLPLRGAMLPKDHEAGETVGSIQSSSRAGLGSVPAAPLTL